MGQAYMELLEHRDEILVQMQAHAAAFDPSLREPVRREFMRSSRTSARRRRLARSVPRASSPMGMLLNVIAALDLPRGLPADVTTSAETLSLFSLRI